MEVDKGHRRPQVEEGAWGHRDQIPVLCTATQRESNKPRYATVKGVIGILNTEIGQITLATLPGTDTTKMGLKGSPTKVKQPSLEEPQTV